MKTNKITQMIYVILSVVVFTLSGCGGGGSSTPTVSTVSGVASSGAPMAGKVFLKDSANSPEMNTTINAQTGAFSFNVTGKTAPYMLRAGTLYSMRNGPGTANINPLTHLIVADAAGFTNMSSMNAFYNNPNGTQMGTISANISASLQLMQQKMAALLNAYGVANADPITGPITIGQGMDRMFDDVKMTIDASGNVTMMYVSGTQLYTGTMADMSTGTMMNGNITTPTVSGITITPSSVNMVMNVSNPPTQQFTANIPVTWSVTPGGGTINATSGLYTAPNVQGMFLVTATSTADSTKSATATVQMGSGGMMM
ncbi:MAG: hypothetical protein PHR66_06575 [Desulfuromonadaceae bacterium]|nr:hypothetical protein [Desulfuromonadaceae bacterium]